MDLERLLTISMGGALFVVGRSDEKALNTAEVWGSLVMIPPGRKVLPVRWVGDSFGSSLSVTADSLPMLSSSSSINALTFIMMLGWGT